MHKTLYRFIHRKTNHPLVLPVAVFFLLFFFSLMLFVVSGARTFGATDAKVVKLSIDGETQSIPTRASTVAELLERLDISVRETDVIEPSLQAPISVNDFRINIYTSRVVLVVDGQNQQLIETAVPSPQSIVKEAGIEVHPEDIVEKDPDFLADPVSVLQSGVVSETIVIKRSVPVFLNLFGVDYELRTHALTVEELLLERGVVLSEASVFPELETVLEPEQAVFVTDPNKEIVMEEEAIAQPQEFTDDFDLLIGQTRVTEEGRPGSRIVVYEITADGSRSILQEVIVRQPTTQVVARGRKPPAVVGDKAEVMAQAGISQSDFYYVDQIIRRESNWGVTAQNAYSGAYGLCQAMPGSKMASAGSDWDSNPTTQLRWCDSYAQQRYGSWANAYDFWERNRWW